MNKRLLMIITTASMLLLAACGAGSASSSWDDAESVAASDRLMADNVEAAWTVEGAAGSEAGTRIRLALTQTGGEPIDAFDVTHEQLLHLIVVSKDLSYFHHIHPAHVGGGVFEIADDFPAGGEYRLIADFKPTGGDAMTKAAWLEVEGDPADPIPLAAQPHGQLSDIAGGKRVDLAIDGLQADEELELTFTVTTDATGEPVRDLEPYLGAIGHVVILSEDGERYVHVHAEEGQGYGPEARFETTFPRSGIYKIWGQFQHEGEVFTVSYVVNVP